MKKTVRCLAKNLPMITLKWTEQGYKVLRIDKDVDRGGQIYAILQLRKDDNE